MEVRVVDEPCAKDLRVGGLQKSSAMRIEVSSTLFIGERLPRKRFERAPMHEALPGVTFRLEAHRLQIASPGAAAQNSIPRCAFTPWSLYGCFTTWMSLTRSAAAMSAAGALRPVTMTCCIGCRVAIVSITSAVSRYS